MTDSPSPVANPIWAAANWLEATLLGSVATTLAIIAVACVGLAMLTGRTDVRRSAHVLFGCFIIFGASAIASGLRTASGGTSSQLADAEVMASPAPPPAYPSAPATPFDPYAGAAVTPRQ